MKAVTFYPGAVTSGDNIDLPSWAPDVDTIVSAELKRSEHEHKAFTVNESESAGGTITDVVTIDDGQGNNLSTVGVDTTDAGGDDEDVPTEVVEAVSNVSVSATKVDEDTITLDADTKAGDELTLTIAPAGVKKRVV